MLVESDHMEGGHLALMVLIFGPQDLYDAGMQYLQLTNIPPEFDFDLVTSEIAPMLHAHHGGFQEHLM